MEYTVSKAIELFKINKLNSKQKNELFLAVASHQHGSYYAHELLTKCSYLLNKEQRQWCLNTLIKNPVQAASFLLSVYATRDDREFIMPYIYKDMYALSELLKIGYENDKKVFTNKELAQLIVSIKDVKEYDCNSKYYNKTIEYIWLYIQKVVPKMLNDFTTLMLRNNNFIFYTFKFNDENFFTSRILDKVYKTNSPFIFKQIKSDYELLIQYFRVFNDYKSDAEEQYIVDKIVKKQDFLTANTLLKYYKVNEDSQNKLNAILIMRELIRD